MAVTTTKQNKTSVLKSQVRAERTSESVSGTPAVAVSGHRQRDSVRSDFCRVPATNKGGGGGGSPLLDRYATSGRQSYAKAGLRWKNLDENRRIRRFYQRYFTGVGVGGRLRFLTLTSSDEAVVMDYDIHKHFRALVKRLRRRWGAFEYMGVVEIKADRHHLHVVFRGSYMEQVLLSAMWASIHKSPVVDIQAVYKVKGGARYLAKYLQKEALNRYWASYNWVFAGWVGWSRRVKRAVGHYPSRALLRSLAVLDKVKRRLAMDFLEYQYRPLWEYSFDKGDLTTA
ncbi:hypothetical protein ES705_44886 [subsurface metagenome]